MKLEMNISDCAFVIMHHNVFSKHIWRETLSRFTQCNHTLLEFLTGYWLVA